MALVSNDNSTTLTLDTLVQGNPQVTTLLNAAFNNSGDVLSVLLHAPLKNPGKFAEIFLSPDPFGFLCDQSSSQLRDLYSIPPDVDVDQVHNAICSTNETAAEELYSLIGGYLLEDHVSNKNTSASWSDIFSNYEKLSGDIQKLLENLPQNFQGVNYNQSFSDLESTVEKFYEKLQLFDDSETNSLIGSFHSALSSIYGQDTDNVTQPYLQSLQAYVDYLNDVLRKVQIENGELNLGSLFENTTALRNVMRFTFGLEENLVEALLGSSINPDMVSLRNLFPGSEFSTV